MMGRMFLMFGAIGALLAVGMGAFGAHGLKEIVSPELMVVYHTGVDYHFYHSLGLLIVGCLLRQSPQLTRLHWTGYLFIVGAVIFSGSLYVLAISGVKWWGAVTPIGGIAFVIGWGIMILALYNDIDES